MQEKEIIQRAVAFVRESLQTDSTGHDFWHVERVWKMAAFLAQREGGNRFVIEMAALLHDIADWKFHNGDLNEGPKRAQAWLCAQNVDKNLTQDICEIIANISFKGARTQENSLSLEGQIVQDADRLDAIGAMGIARTFAYGGFMGQPIYDPEIKPTHHATAKAYFQDKTHTINHFYEKLLLLKDRLHTPTAKKIAEKRHHFMEQFLSQFYEEWSFEER